MQMFCIWFLPRVEMLRDALKNNNKVSSIVNEVFGVLCLSSLPLCSWGCLGLFFCCFLFAFCSNHVLFFSDRTHIFSMKLTNDNSQHLSACSVRQTLKKQKDLFICSGCSGLCCAAFSRCGGLGLP